MVSKFLTQKQIDELLEEHDKQEEMRVSSTSSQGFYTMYLNQTQKNKDG